MIEYATIINNMYYWGINEQRKFPREQMRSMIDLSLALVDKIANGNSILSV